MIKSNFRFLFVVFCLFTSTNPLHAQWIQTSVPYAGAVWSLAVSGTNLFAGTYDGGVFLSTNDGTSWTAVNNGLENPHVSCLVVSPNGAGGTNLFAGTNGCGVFLSNKNGTSWTQFKAGMTNSNIYALAVSSNGAGGTNLFAGTYLGGVYLSTNNGTSWSAVNTGLTNTHVLSLAVSGTNLFAGIVGGIWRRPLSDFVTSVEKLSTDLPRHFSLEQNYPNPFNP
jgi:ligand-binding sensor domain-containing protein